MRKKYLNSLTQSTTAFTPALYARYFRRNRFSLRNSSYRFGDDGFVDNHFQKADVLSLHEHL